MTRETLRRQDLYAMVGLVALAGLVFILWSHLGDELIPVRNGIGYDGVVYSHVTRDPLATVFGHELDVHRVQRVVPSLAVYVMLAPFGLNESNAAIVVGFQLFNYGLMALAALLWWQIGRRVELSRTAGWVGFCALLLNYGLIKFQAYSPTMTDTAGFLLGLAVVWCMVFKRLNLLPLVAFVGAFTWPPVAYSALLLFTLSRAAPPLLPSRRWGLATASVLALAIPAFGVHVWRCGDSCGSALMRTSVMPGVLLLSAAFLVFWVFFAFRPLLELVTVPNVLRALDWRRLAISVVLLVAVGLVQRKLADPSGLTVSRTLLNTALGGVAKPAGFLVAHAVYFGPAVLLLVLTWHRAVAAVRQFGIGPVAMTLGFLLIATTNEARILMNVWPMFVLLAALVVNQLGWQAREGWLFAGLCLVTSRVWFPVFHGEYTGDWRAYPDQYYGMSMGLKMTTFSYVMMATASLAVGCIVLWMIRRSPARAPAPEAVPVG